MAPKTNSNAARTVRRMIGTNMRKENTSGRNVQAAIVREQVHLALRHLPTVQLVSFVIALILAYSVRGVVSRSSIIVWVLLVLAVVASRIVYYTRYVRVREETFDGEYWKKVYLLLTLASGLIWGGSAFIIFPAGNSGLIYFFVLVIASLSATTTVSHSSLKYGPTAWMAPALFSYSARCLVEGGEATRTVGVLIIIYFLTLFRYSFDHHKSITASISLRFENLKLLDDVRKSEASYHNLFDSLNDAIWILGEEGRILDVNKGAEVMYGQPREFFVDRTPEALSAAGMNDPADMTAAIGRAFRNGPQLIDFWGVRGSGGVFPQEVRLVPASYGGRRVVLAVARDISERKRAEAELLRTQKLEAVSVLAGGIAHDFNNLLQSVFGYLAVAKRKIDKRDKALLMIDKADSILQMSAKLTTQLLTFSKGGTPLKRTIALGPVVENAAGFSLSGSRSGCRFDLPEDLWTVEADDGQIGQVVQNLVLNADQAMPGGGVVKIAAANVDLRGAPSKSVPGPGKWVKLEVSDSGTGVSDENLPRIFEPYFTTKPNGSGLGLATSYSIMKSHDGLIEVTSREGKGSTFTVWLPAGGKSVLQQRAAEATSSVIRKGRALVMDDEASVRDSVGEMLAALGQEVEFAADGTSAIEKYLAARAAGSPFDLVILDATVRGGMGGEETVKKLREINPDLVAVISSGYSDDALLANYGDHGFKAFLHKPYRYESLQSVLGSLMK